MGNETTVLKSRKDAVSVDNVNDTVGNDQENSTPLKEVSLWMNITLVLPNGVEAKNIAGAKIPNPDLISAADLKRYYTESDGKTPTARYKALKVLWNAAKAGSTELNPEKVTIRGSLNLIDPNVVEEAVVVDEFKIEDLF